MRVKRSGAVTGARIFHLIATSFWPASAPAIAKELRMTEQNIRQALAALEGAGILTSTVLLAPRRPKMRVYTIAGYGYCPKAMVPGNTPVSGNKGRDE